MIKQKIVRNLILFTLLLLSPFLAFGQDDGIPDAPKPARLVNDFAGFLTAEEQNYLERKLVAVDDTTSTQIAVVIVKSLNGYTPNEFVTRLGIKWGVGRAEKQRNNGIVILVKPKTADERGEAYIATGYGMESFVTDALSRRIVNNEMIPAFQAGRNFEGLDRATDVLISLAKGQFTVDQYVKKGKSKKKEFPLVALIVIVVLIIVFFFRGSGGSSGSRHISTGGLPLWLLLGGLGSGRSSGGFGDFSSGGGGFGGFGGGGFGGGGAGGSW